MTLLLPCFFQETGAEDQAGKSKKNVLPQNTAIEESTRNAQHFNI